MPVVLPIATGAAIVVLLSRYPTALVALAVTAALVLAVRFAVARRAR